MIVLSGVVGQAALKRYVTAKQAQLAEDYRAIPRVSQALDAFAVTTDCLRPRLISGQAPASWAVIPWRLYSVP